MVSFSTFYNQTFELLSVVLSPVIMHLFTAVYNSILSLFMEKLSIYPIKLGASICYQILLRSLSDPNVTRIRKGAIWDASEKIISCLFPIPCETICSSIWYWWQNLVSKIESILVCNYHVLENHSKKPHGHIKKTKSCVDWIIFLLPKYASVVVFSLKTMVATSPGWSCWCTEDAINVQAVTILPFFHNFFLSTFGQQFTI